MTSARRIGREPIQKPGKSKQDYGTPWRLIKAIQAAWGPLTVDLAATQLNAKCAKFITPEEDSLSSKISWAEEIGAGIGWLNPPFADIAPWAKKCRFEAKEGAKVIMLTPASIGSEWFADYCEGFAKVVGLRPRLTFEGCKDPCPKDCMLTLWGAIDRLLPDLSTWRWDR